MATASRPLLDRTVASVVFDWDGTAVPDRRSSARRVRSRIERLSRLGVHTAIVSGTNLKNIDGQLRARPSGPGRLLYALNRGSELFEVTAGGPRLLAHLCEDEQLTERLDHVAATVAARLQSHGLRVEVGPPRLNRRKIDLIPEPDWSDPPKSRIGDLLLAVEERLHRADLGSLAHVAALTRESAAESGLSDSRITTDAKHIEVGVSDKADSMRAVLKFLADVGVTGELILVVGDEFGTLGGIPGSDSMMQIPEAGSATVVSVGVEPSGVPSSVQHYRGGPDMFVGLLDEQIRRARLRRVPSIDPEPQWTLIERGVNVARHRVTESLFTLASGGVGVRGSVEESPGFGQPLVVAAGVYEGPAALDGLLPGPDVIDLRFTPPVSEDLRILDLRTGMLYRKEIRDSGVPLRSLRFASIGEAGVLALRVECGVGRLHQEAAPPGHISWTATTGPLGGIGTKLEHLSSHDDGVTTTQRIVAIESSRSAVPNRARAGRRLAHATQQGFESLVCVQRAGWARRWEAVNVHIPDDPPIERALRFALFQLWGLGGSDRELAVGARGLSGGGYAGHVFWDADVFVLPALVCIDPHAAEAMVRYRLNRLAAARSRARAEGRAGARYPWESALDGRDVTPASGYVGGVRVPILTGTWEEHITADVAWATVRNAVWSRPSARLGEREAELLGDTARYWASRIRTDTEGLGHIDKVIGPDEYHEDVDDNAFTNVMARWNLGVAARYAPAAREEREAWERLAGSLVDGYDPRTGRYEQFTGYFDLEPLLVRDIAPPPVAADVLLGRERIERTQVCKQPDVLMLHHLLPDDTAPGSLAPNLAFYAPRTAHGSSLSPAVMASLHARAGEPDTALELLRLSLSIDLDDLGGTTSAGVHIGACGGAWQAVIHGFLGARVSAGVLALDPVLPTSWPRLEVRFRCLGRDVRVAVDGTRVRVDASAPMTVELPQRWRGDAGPGVSIRPSPRDATREHAGPSGR